MKTRLWLLAVAVLMLALSAHGQLLSVDKTLTANFNQPASTQAYPMRYCAASVADTCVNSYTETLVDPTGKSTTIVIPYSSTDISGTAIAHAYTPAGNLYCGTWGVSVVANWLDPSGKPVDSTALTGSVVAMASGGTSTNPCPFTGNPATSLKLTVTP